MRRTLATTTLATLIALATIAPSHAGEVTVLWTAPGSDGVLGCAAAYDLRYSSEPIADEAGFAAAIVVPGLPAPGMPGTTESCTVGGLEVGVTYYFAIKTVDEAGNWSPLSNVLSGGIPEVYGQAAPRELAFSAPWPNPARERTGFRCVLPAAAPVRVEVFDVTGRRVRLLARADFAAGLVDLAFDLRDDAGARLPRGVYLVRARLGAHVFTRRLAVVR